MSRDSNKRFQLSRDYNPITAHFNSSNKPQLSLDPQFTIDNSITQSDLNNDLYQKNIPNVKLELPSSSVLSQLRKIKKHPFTFTTNFPDHLIPKIYKLPTNLLLDLSRLRNPPLQTTIPKTKYLKNPISWNPYEAYRQQNQRVEKLSLKLVNTFLTKAIDDIGISNLRVFNNPHGMYKNPYVPVSVTFKAITSKGVDKGMDFAKDKALPAVLRYWKKTRATKALLSLSGIVLAGGYTYLTTHIEKLILPPDSIIPDINGFNIGYSIKLNWKEGENKSEFILKFSGKLR